MAILKATFFGRDEPEDEEEGEYLVPAAGRREVNQAYHRLVAAFMAAVTAHGSPFGITGDKATGVVCDIGQ